MAYRVVWSGRAVSDLEAIADYIAQDSPAYAAVVVRTILGRTKTLSHLAIASSIEFRKAKRS